MGKTFQKEMDDGTTEVGGGISSVSPGQEGERLLHAVS